MFIHNIITIIQALVYHSTLIYIGIKSIAFLKVYTMTAVSVQEAIESLAPHLTWKVILKFVWILSMRSSGPVLAMFTYFGGFLPYKQWVCLENSTECITRVNFSGVSRESYCGVEGQEALVVGKDMVWELDGRKTYAVDWNLLCEREYLGTFISSSYFVGALLGLLVSSSLFDRFGRLRVAQIAQIMSIVVCLIMAFAHDIKYLMIVRCLYGGFFFVSNTGFYILTIELIPKSLKAKGMALGLAMWTTGQFILTVVGYCFKDWKFIVIIGALILCLNLYPIFCILPESPLYYLSNRRDKLAAKESLKKLSQLFGTNCSFEDDELVDRNDDIGNSMEQSIIEALRDFIKYPILSKHVAILLFVWLKCGWLYYGFTFSWGRLGRNIYISYLLNSFGEAVAMTLILIYFIKMPRRYLGYFDIVAAVMLLVAITPEQIGFGVISVSQLACLVGAEASSAVFGAQFLLTQELSPTTHRGKILGLSSSSARIGSLLGPQASLMFTWNKTATLCIFASVAFISGVLMLLLPETKGHVMPSQASDVISRTEQVRLKKYKKIQEQDAEIPDENV